MIMLISYFCRVILLYYVLEPVEGSNNRVIYKSSIINHWDIMLCIDAPKSKR